MPYPDLDPDPNFERLLTVLRRGTPDRVPLIECYINYPVGGETPSPGDPRSHWRDVARIWRRLGYDGFPVDAPFDLPMGHLTTKDTASDGDREWRDEHRGVIENWEDFEKYPWPAASDVDYSHLDYAAEALPEGMKLIGADPGGVFEGAIGLMGFEALSYAMAEQPDLVQAVFDKCGEIMLNVCQTHASHEAVGAVILGDDLGFKTQTMISPDALRKHLFPWHKRIAEAVHAYGKPLIFHACGNIEAVMEDLIEAVGIDGRHSFEDAITPITAAKRRWGDRVALLGGIDMDLLARGTPQQVRERTREVLEACMPGGGFALGSGNSIANYVKTENYFAMLEEGWRLGVY